MESAPEQDLLDVVGAGGFSVNSSFDNSLLEEECCICLDPMCASKQNLQLLSLGKIACGN